MATRPTRVFAIRMGSWVELRAAHQPPTRETSRVKREGTKPEYERYSWGGTRWPLKVVGEKPFTFYLRVTVFEGGQYLSSVKARSWIQKPQLFGVKVPPKHGMVELPPEVAAKLLTKRGRKAYLGKRG